MHDLQEVEIILAWQTYSVGARIRPNGTLRQWLIANGYARLVEAETPARPARLGAKAVKKLADGAKGLFK